MATTESTTPHAEKLACLPQELRAKRIWCIWRYEERDGRQTKVPHYLVSATVAARAASNDPATWMTFADACAAADSDPGFGVGLFCDGTFTFIDLDHCRDAEMGLNEPWADEIVRRLNGYTELSPSNTGLHIFVAGAVSAAVKKNGVEMYSTGRFATVTGSHIGGEYGPCPELEAIRAEAAAGKIGNVAQPKFVITSALARLEAGENPSGDTSEDDYQYVCLLAEQGLTDAAIDERFRVSGRMRDKWDRNAGGGQTYGQRTLARMRERQAKPKEQPQGFRGPAVAGSDYDYVVGAKDDEEGWFPRGDVSLVAAFSGGGKTTFVSDMLEKQAERQTFYGRETFGLGYVVCMADRGERGLRRTLGRMHIDIDKFPYWRMNDEEDLVKQVEDAILQTSPTPAVIFLEGIDLLGDSNKGVDVSRTLGRLARLCHHYHISVIGSTGCPKMRPKDAYRSLREMVTGSAVWSRKVETIAVLQKEGGRETDDITVLTILPRQSKAMEYKLRFRCGRLEEIPAAELEAKAAIKANEDFVQWVLDQDTFTANDVKRKFSGMNGTYRRKRLDGLVAAGMIKERTNKGKTYYEVVRAEPEPDEFTAAVNAAL